MANKKCFKFTQSKTIKLIRINSTFVGDYIKCLNDTGYYCVKLPEQTIIDQTNDNIKVCVGKKFYNKHKDNLLKFGITHE